MQAARRTILRAAILVVTMLHVAFGDGAQIQDRVSGALQFGPLAAADALSRSNMGVRISAVSSARSELAPDIPTIAEAGITGYDFALRHSLFAPAQTPRPSAQRLRAAAAAATWDEATQARFPRIGMVPILDTAEEFARIVSDPQERLMPWLKTLI